MTPRTASANAPAADREELLRLLLRDGILYRSPTQPVLSRDGSSARWMLDSLSVSMRPRGAELAGRCLAGLLEKFDGRQIATYGMTGVPLMQAAIMQSRGRCHGLIVRKEKKAHGSLKRIEGKIDRLEPTILLDDSVSSGLSMREGTAFLEEAGLRVEGGVALVRFGWDAGFARMRERGYHMEAVFDVYEDIMENMDDEPKLNRNPTRWVREFPWGEQQAPEGLHPAQLARLAMDTWLDSGLLPRPPATLDEEYDARGGVWVSLRDRDQIYHRYARDGFWTFPGEAQRSAPEELLRAALQTAKGLGSDPGKARRILERSHVGVTFFTPLEKCGPGQLDNDRYGIVVCSRERPGRIGGALPRMPGISNEWEQFRHAHTKNAKLYSFEEFDVYRHELRKAVEPGVAWQPSGVPLAERDPWHADPAIGGAAAARALDMVRALAFGTPLGTEEPGTPLPDGRFPEALHSLYVTVYINGRMRGCAGSPIRQPDRDLRVLAEAAFRDARFAFRAGETTERVAVTVSLLFNSLELGAMSVEEVAPRFRLGKQALAVEQNQRYGMLLPFVAVTNNLDPVAYAAEVIDKAGITRAPWRWTRFDCATWLADARGVEPIEYAFRLPATEYRFEEAVRELTEWQTEYILRNIDCSADRHGAFFATFRPFQNQVCRGHDAARATHAVWILLKAGLSLAHSAAVQAAEKLLDGYLSKIRESEAGLWLEEDCAEGAEPSVAELSFLLLAISEAAPNDRRREYGARIAAALWSRIDEHGRIATHRNQAAAHDRYQDYAPGQVLLALATARVSRLTPAELAPKDEMRLAAAFSFYRHRFRYKRDFGQVSWMMQAGHRWWQAGGGEAWADLVFEIGDWVRQYQSEKSGGFMNRHQHDGPGYTTALYLEGLAAAADLAARRGDRRRYVDAIGACENGFRFLRRITIRPEHSSMLPSPGYALGGLRQSLTASNVRLDFVQHSLAAALALHSGFRVSEADRPARTELNQSRRQPAFQPAD